MRLLLALLLSFCLPLAHAAAPATAEVAVLVSLHQLHGEVPAYSESVLGQSIERLEPDVLCIEVRPDRYARRAPEATKVEYPDVVYPLIDAHGYRVYPMEPMPPLHEDILGPYMAANQAFNAAQPQAAAAFSAHTDALYAVLRAYWTTPARVNDAVTDAQMRAKHDLQIALIGAGERDGWEAWNQQFLAVITRAASENPGKQIVVLVGAEHGYWLRAALAKVPGLRLLDTADLLPAPGG